MYPEIPGYKIIRNLGAGAMAKVYLATDDLGRQVALKVMNESLALDPEYRDRFINEGTDTAKFNHEGIVKIWQRGVHQNHYYLSLEYIEGGTLKDNLQARKKHQDSHDGGQGHLYSSSEALRLLKRLAEALAYAHDKHVIHRDIKPENILFRLDGNAVINDFGIAKSVDEKKNLTMAGYRVGTPAYMSPEQMLGADVDARSDIYSLGVVFYEILVGYRPYRSSASEYSELIKQLDEPVPEFPQKLSHLQPLLLKMLAKRPDQRAQSVHELIRLINQLSHPPASGSSDKTVIQPIVKAEDQPLRFWQKPLIKWLALIVTGLGIIAITLSIVWQQLTEQQQVQVDPEPVDERTSKTISELLDSAKIHVEFDQIIYPRGSNATENLVRVLELQPGNKDALDGLKQAEALLLEQIQQEIENGNPNAAISMTELGLHFFPDSKDLVDLKKQLGKK